MAQSRYWTDTSGLVTVTRADGSRFRTNPTNLAVESELYTRFLEDDAKDTSIEDWFAEAIDRPATRMIDHLLDGANAKRKPFRGDPRKAATVKLVGFRVNPYFDYVSIPPTIRQSISEYVAALLVRHPDYLSKLVAFHEPDAKSSAIAKSLALDNMIRLHRIYASIISQSVFLLTRRVGSAEYIYADGGIVVEEPWRTEFNIPFDIHAPLTPDLALQVLPVSLGSRSDLEEAAISESTNQGVARQNRIVLGAAKRFVFSRQTVPSSFIASNIGKPAPKNIGYRVIDGRLETFYDPTRT